jgi:alpha-ketoglutarate-dependent taurine dioxygenase
MTNSDREKPSMKSLGAIRRKTIDTSQEALIRTEPLLPETNLPLVALPAIDGIDLVDWAKSNRERIESYLSAHGGILFRKFTLTGLDRFNQFISAVAGKSMEYHEGASPRTQLSDNIYTSTDYPAYQSIFLHNELAYRQVFPMKIFFFCVIPAKQGGATIIADVRKIYKRIDPTIRAVFTQKGWMLVRNFGDGFGLPWQEVFHTTDKAEVERYCRSVDIEFEWKDGDRLRTRQVRRAVAKHPHTGEMVWFNHATFFHVSTLEPTMRDAFLAEYKDEDLPTNTYYGDGSPIEPSVLEELREVHAQETVSFPWQEGDLLLLDNMLTAHGRAPYIGPRRIVVGMAEPRSWSDIAV